MKLGAIFELSQFHPHYGSSSSNRWQDVFFGVFVFAIVIVISFILLDIYNFFRLLALFQSDLEYEMRDMMQTFLKTFKKKIRQLLLSDQGSKFPFFRHLMLKMTWNFQCYVGNCYYSSIFEILGTIGLLWTYFFYRKVGESWRWLFIWFRFGKN